MLELIFAIVKRVCEIFNRLYQTTKYYLTSQFANLLISISICLTVAALIVLLLIIFDPFRLHFTVVDASFSDYTGESLFGEFERLANLYNIYVSLQAFNAFFLILRLLLIFGFSGELSLVLDLISDALLDFIFFILMFCLVRSSFLILNRSFFFFFAR